MDRKSHWQRVYATKEPTAVSWYQAHADRSVDLIRAIGVTLGAAIIDVGSGASRLIDDLVAQGYSNITALDLSGSALAATRARLGERGRGVHWMEADVTRASLPAGAFDIWHDRAVFHFLTEPGERRAYVDAATRSLKPGGHVIVATFAEDGPMKCSGLPVQRYSPRELHSEFGPRFELVRSEREVHLTPSGAEQRFVYCCFRLLDE